MYLPIRILVPSLFAAVIFSGSHVNATVKPAVIFTDDAVLQRDIDLPIWGTARDGEEITVSLNGQIAATKAQGGTWSVRLKPMKAGGPYTIAIKGENAVELKNVFIGEVWLCSGQSNMQWPLKETDGAQTFIRGSKDSGLHLFTVPLATASAPATDLAAGNWVTCSPNTASDFSAVAYHFGRHLRKSLGDDVHIGLIHSSYGGSILQAWTAMPYIQSDPESRKYLDHLPSWAAGPQNGFSVLYNGMIAPIVSYGMRGVIWYQGEGNTESTEPEHYSTSFPLLIRNWREAWGQGDFPFLFVQLPPWAQDDFFHVSVDPDATGWAVLRDSQSATVRTVKNTAVVVTMDLGDPDRIHPRCKEPVGARLALAAEAVAYGKDVIYKSPTFKSLAVTDDKAAVVFEDASEGLAAHGEEIVGFTVAGSDRKFYEAHARVTDRQQIEVWSEHVPHPAAVRYGWSNYAVVNVFNKSGLPLTPFRTDDWPAEKPFKTYPWPREAR